MIYSCDHTHSNMIELFYLVNLYNAQRPNPCQILQYNLIEEGLCCNFSLKTSRSFNMMLEMILRTKPLVHTVATISLFLSMFSLSLWWPKINELLYFLEPFGTNPRANFIMGLNLRTQFCCGSTNRLVLRNESIYNEPQSIELQIWQLADTIVS